LEEIVGFYIGSLPIGGLTGVGFLDWVYFKGKIVVFALENPLKIVAKSPET